MVEAVASKTLRRAIRLQPLWQQPVYTISSEYCYCTRASQRHIQGPPRGGGWLCLGPILSLGSLLTLCHIYIVRFFSLIFFCSNICTISYLLYKNQFT